MKKLLCTLIFTVGVTQGLRADYYVAPSGDDSSPGTLTQPFASLGRAQQAVRKKPGTVFLRSGTYYLPETLVFTSADSGTTNAPTVFQAYRGETPVISGG